jgi:hypothetical protein
MISRIVGAPALVDTATLFIHSNDPATPRFAVPMRGTGFMDVVTSADALPGEFALEQNYPNPFNPVTEIQFRVQREEWVRLSVYDLLGRQVAVLVDGALEAGRHTAAFDASGLASGVYLCRLTAGGRTAVRTMLLLR